MHDALQIVTVVAWGALKMLVAASLGAGFGFGFLKNFLLTALGGCLGVFVFYQLSERLTEWARLRWLRARERDIERRRVVARVFTRRNRWIIRMKHASGYLGVAALTPLVLTIPIGSILAARFFRHDRRTLPAVLLSVVLQSLVVSAVLTGVADRITGVLP